MADHKKLQIFKALTTLIEAADYEPSLVGLVKRGRNLFSSEEGTLVSLLEHPNNIEPQYTVTPGGDDSNQRWVVWNIICQGWTEDDQDNPCDPVYPLLAAVEKQLSRIVALDIGGSGAYPEYRLGGLVGDAFVSQGFVRPADVGISDKAFFLMNIQLKFPFDCNNPTGV